MFDSILTGTTGFINISQVAVCTLASLACGLVTALCYRIAEKPSRNFLISAVILPAVVQMVILAVNGNLGVGVAIAGSFSLVRFRSLPGKASDIVMIFLAMTAGLLTGMGYVWLALAMSVTLSLVFAAVSKLPLFAGDEKERTLRITIPEDLDYTSVFSDIFDEYTSSCRQVAARTVNLGTMYQLTYEIKLRKAEDEKKMIDAIRVRNGNLGIVCGHQAITAQEM